MPFRFQFEVIAADSRSPVRQATATVRITVIKLTGPPKFSFPDYKVEIPITQGVNTTVISPTAVDNDVQGQLRYNVLGFRPGTDYFYMEETGGNAVIKVKQNLVNNLDPNPIYVVSIANKYWIYRYKLYHSIKIWWYNFPLFNQEP